MQILIPITSIINFFIFFGSDPFQILDKYIMKFPDCEQKRLIPIDFGFSFWIIFLFFFLSFFFFFFSGFGFGFGKQENLFQIQYLAENIKFCLEKIQKCDLEVEGDILSKDG